MDSNLNKSSESYRVQESLEESFVPQTFAFKDFPSNCEKLRAPVVMRIKTMQNYFKRHL